VIGLYFYAFNGAGPLGGILAGWLSARGGTELAFFVAGAAGIVGTAVAAARLRGRVQAAPARLRPDRGTNAAQASGANAR
jgi:hypothetical protein